MEKQNWEEVCFGEDRSTRANLKWILMELGNRLVTDHGFCPGPKSLVHSIHSARYGDDPAYRRGNLTAMLIALTEMINRSPEMQQALESMGVEWPVVESKNEENGDG